MCLVVYSNSMVQNESLPSRRALQTEEPSGLHLHFTPLLRFIFSSLNQAPNSASKWAGADPYPTVSGMHSHKVGGSLKQWIYEPILMGRRESDLGKNSTCHVEQMRLASPCVLCVLGKLSLTTKLNIQMPVLPLQLIHLNRATYVNSLTGIKGVIYLHAVSCIHIAGSGPLGTHQVSLPCMSLSHNLM